jgi:hypothetical protein
MEIASPIRNEDEVGESTETDVSHSFCFNQSQCFANLTFISFFQGDRLRGLKGDRSNGGQATQ